ncbi:MAG: hypothetical protein J1F69_04170 [Clostridiales bacterium]|nr:hypothetical protein [Clostridiales bacterium]
MEKTETEKTQINIKSNMAFLIKIMLSLAIFGFIVVVAMSIALIVDYSEQKESIPEFIFFISYTAVMIAGMLIVKLYRGRRYEFTESEIICYNRKNLTERINVSQIEAIVFFKFALIGAADPCYILQQGRGACWSLYIKMKDGTIKVLKFFSKKDALLLKEKLFGDLLTIIK